MVNLPPTGRIATCGPYIWLINCMSLNRQVSPASYTVMPLSYAIT